MASSTVQLWREAWPLHEAAAMEAFRLFQSWCTTPLCRVPGMGTPDRLAIRIHLGRSVEEAAAREYCYRWRLALQSPVFGVPHLLGA